MSYMAVDPCEGYGNNSSVAPRTFAQQSYLDQARMVVYRSCFALNCKDINGIIYYGIWHPPRFKPGLSAVQIHTLKYLLYST